MPSQRLRSVVRTLPTGERRLKYQESYNIRDFGHSRGRAGIMHPAFLPQLPRRIRQLHSSRQWQHNARDLDLTQATPLTVRIADPGDVPGLFAEQASLSLDNFRCAVKPDPPIWNYSTANSAISTTLQHSLCTLKDSSAASDRGRSLENEWFWEEVWG